MSIFRDESNIQLYSADDVNWKKQRKNFFLFPIFTNLFLIFAAFLLAALAVVLYLFVLKPFFIDHYLIEGRFSFGQWFGAIAITALICMASLPALADLMVIFIYNFYFLTRIKHFKIITVLKENQKIPELLEIAHIAYMTDIAKNKYFKKVNDFAFNTFRKQRFAIAALTEIGTSEAIEALENFETENIRKKRLLVLALQKLKAA